VRVEINSRQRAVRLPAREVRRVLELALRLEGRDGELSVALVGDEEMTALNGRFLGMARVTDVLAFPYSAESGASDCSAAGDVLAGEIVVNAELAAREAAGRSHGPQDELLLYLVHGLLHLLGYDDHKAVDRRRMRQREAEVLAAAERKAQF
jgi:probable rRNA maturation factor